MPYYIFVDIKKVKPLYTRKQWTERKINFTKVVTEINIEQNHTERELF